MSGKKPSAKELGQAVRFLRHAENCKRCRSHTWNDTCFQGYGHFLRWGDTYYAEVVDVNAAKRKARWGLPRS